MRPVPLAVSLTTLQEIFPEQSLQELGRDEETYMYYY
jgi:hypothetical protein